MATRTFFALVAVLGTLASCTTTEDVKYYVSIDEEIDVKHVPVLKPSPYKISLDLSNVLQGLSGIIPGLPKTDGTRIVNNPANLINRPGVPQQPYPQRPPPSTQNPQQLDPLLTIDLCFFLGDDVLDSHLRYFNWFQQNEQGYKDYINLLTLETTKIMNKVDPTGKEYNNDFLLTWQGPWRRSDYDRKYPDNAREDTKRASQRDCDMVIFMIFNNYTTTDSTTGHDISGYAEGAACEAKFGSGFAAVVDQGFYKDYWIGPQILAHHIYLLLTEDLYTPDKRNPTKRIESRNCPNPNSILYSEILAKTQYRDACVNDKLERSQIPRRNCLHD